MSKVILVAIQLLAAAALIAVYCAPGAWVAYGLAEGGWPPASTVTVGAGMSILTAAFLKTVYEPEVRE